MKTRQLAPSGQVRIIGGKWRNTRLSVPSVDGLRPSSDRMRETLFNWLQPVLPGAVVVDAFAGTGALGLEALSRGAASVVMIERDSGLHANLKTVLGKLQGGEAGKLLLGDALQCLTRQSPAAFDLAFIDPPFAAGLWSQLWPLLDVCLKPDAWLYVESPPDAADAVPPSHWQLHREMSTKDACGRLYRRTGAS